MRELTILKAGNSRFLGEFLQDLPDNCIFNKVLTGAGGTQVALSNDKNYVIAVPFINLIKSKVNQNDNILGVFGGISTVEITNYLNNQDIKVKKIMVTYDSLPKLLEYIDPKEYKILIDESHKLVDSAGFRRKAIQSILDNYTKFNSYVFMTATPVKDKYQLPALVEIPKVTVKWENITPVSIEYTILQSKFKQKIAAIVSSYLNNDKKGNPYFFLNSVTSIVGIIRLLKKVGYTDPNLFRIICASNSENEAKIKTLGKGFSISDTTSPNSKITFLTATAFEGCDLYDENGITYIATDGQRDSTKIDTITLLPQIIGRLRDSKSKHSVKVIFTPSPYFSYTTEEEYAAYIKSQLNSAKETIELYNTIKSNDFLKEATLSKAETNPFFLLNEDGELTVDELSMYSEMHRFESLNVTYYVKKDANGKPISNQEPHTKNINNIEYNYKPNLQDEDLSLYDKITLEDKYSFSDILQSYVSFREEKKTSKGYVNYPDLILAIHRTKEFELIKRAYEELGVERIEALDYRKGKILESLVIKDGKTSNSSKIVKLLGYQTGQFIPAKEAKEKIGEIYSKLNIKTVAKGTDLFDWYDVKEKTKRVEGNVVKGYIILMKKYK